MEKMKVFIGENDAKNTGSSEELGTAVDIDHVP
jgi:hypothetical protein